MVSAASPASSIARCSPSMVANASIWVRERVARPAPRTPAPPPRRTDPLGGRQRLDRRLGPLADPAPRHVQDAPHRHVVGRVGDRAQVGDRVAHLTPLVEPDAADHPVRHADPDEHLLEGTRLGVGAVEHRHVARLGVLGVGQPVDLVGDVLGLVVLGVGHPADDPLAVAGVRPEPLLGTPRVAGDHRVGGVQDGLGGAVVLLQHDGGGAGEVGLEGQDVADRGAAERVDRLVGVAHHHQLGRLDGGHALGHRQLGAQLADQRVLGVVGVLVLVDQHVPEPPPVLLAQVGERLQQVHRGHDQVVEVERVGRLQPLLVLAVGVGVDLLVVGLGPCGGGLVVDQFVLAVRHPVHHLTNRVTLGVDLGVAQHQRHQPLGVGVVVDRERAADPEPVDVGPQDAHARRVEGGDPHQLGPVAHQFDHPVPHLGGRLVGERDRQDRTGMDVAEAHQVRDPPGQHPRLARPRAGHHQHRRARVQHRLALRRVEVGQQLVLGDALAPHRAVLAGPGRAFGMTMGSCTGRTPSPLTRRAGAGRLRRS